MVMTVPKLVLLVDLTAWNLITAFPGNPGFAAMEKVCIN